MARKTKPHPPRHPSREEQIENLNRQIETLRMQLSDANDTNYAHENTISDLKSKVSNLKYEVSEKENQISDLENKVSSLEQKVSDKESQIQTLEYDLSNARNGRNY